MTKPSGTLVSMNNTRLIMMAVVLSWVAAGNPLVEASSQLGVWNFNAEKSQVPTGIGKNKTVTCIETGNQIKVTMDGTDSDGKLLHSVWMGKFDGKSYPVKGSLAYDSVEYRVINDHRFSVQAFKNGELMWSGEIVISKDGKTRTANLKWLDESGKTLTTKKVYDKA